MNITPEMMYWLTRCDIIVGAGVIMSIVFVVMFAFAALHILIDEADSLAIRLVCTLFFVCAFLSACVAVFVPSTRDMAAIYVVPKIANSETVKDLGEGIVTLASEWIQELRPNKQNGGAK